MYERRIEASFNLPRAEFFGRGTCYRRLPKVGHAARGRIQPPNELSSETLRQFLTDIT